MTLITPCRGTTASTWVSTGSDPATGPGLDGRGRLMGVLVRAASRASLRLVVGRWRYGKRPVKILHRGLHHGASSWRRHYFASCFRWDGTESFSGSGGTNCASWYDGQPAVTWLPFGVPGITSLWWPCHEMLLQLPETNHRGP